MARVTFPTFSPFLPRDIAAAEDRNGDADAVGELFLPEDRAGPVPGVVISEGLAGLKKRRECAYGKFLANCGCACLAVDSFAARRASWLKDDVRALLVTEAMMIADAYAGLRFLRRHPAVDKNRIYLFGFSYGGMVSLLAAYDQFAERLAEEGERFAGHASFYGCSIPRLQDHRTTGAPVLMMLGENDRNVSIPRSEAIAEDLTMGGSHVDMETIHDVYHQWDGSDVKMRHVKYSLRRCAVRIDQDSESFDEDTGKRIGGPVSRTLFLVRRADSSGYDILRDEDAMRHSAGRLLDFIGCRGPDARAAIEAHIEATRPEGARGPGEDRAAMPSARPDP